MSLYKEEIMCKVLVNLMSLTMVILRGAISSPLIQLMANIGNRFISLSCFQGRKNVMVAPH